MEKVNMEKKKLIICVYACDKIPKYISEIETINNTWGKLCTDNIKLLYFLGEKVNPQFTGEQYINLPNVLDDYASASYKQFLGLKYISENYTTDFVICCGTDTYLNIPKLSLFLNQFDPTENLYIGGHGDVIKIGDKQCYYHTGGPGIILTQHCLRALYPRLNTLMADWLNICNTHNLNLHTACDVAISYFLQQENTIIVKMNDLSFTHCNYHGWPCHQRYVQPRQIIACHTMTPRDFYDFTRFSLVNLFNPFTSFGGSGTWLDSIVAGPGASGGSAMRYWVYMVYAIIFGVGFSIVTTCWEELKK